MMTNSKELIRISMLEWLNLHPDSKESILEMVELYSKKREFNRFSGYHMLALAALLEQKEKEVQRYREALEKISAMDYEGDFSQLTAETIAEQALNGGSDD